MMLTQAATMMAASAARGTAASRSPATSRVIATTLAPITPTREVTLPRAAGTAARLADETGIPCRSPALRSALANPASFWLGSMR
jgi:hypothetical protein